LEKPKKSNWDDCGFAGDRTCPCIRTCIVPGGGVDKIAIEEEYKRRWQILVSSQGVVQGFRAKYCEALQAKSPDNYTRVKKQLWEKQWVVLPKSLWKS
jgi:hypothetical protein